MPSQAVSSPDAKQMYINGHFCYADKLGIITNGLGIIKHTSFFDEPFKEQHSDIIIEKIPTPLTKINRLVIPLL